ncbi:MAG: putative peptide zinc metalloprotease protein [Frankiaceae bacterium]|jgi:putative peptide zinc metalloprotease protein|nr:putative peptide zinc metalloprotease protein [Frankiaceae bacterium]
MRRLTALLLVPLAAVGLVGVATPAYAGGGDTTAVAINTKDGFDLFRLAFQIKRATGDVVDNGNAAVAYASCTECQTIALSIQIVLISGYDSSTVSPENVAIAINENCTLCDTLASAYQFVLTAEGNLHFTAAGNQRLAEIRRQLLALRKSGLTAAEIQAKVDALMTELADILSTELVPAGNSGANAAPSGSPSAAPATASPTGATSDAPTAQPLDTSSPSESPSDSPSTDPSATASP